MSIRTYKNSPYSIVDDELTIVLSEHWVDVGIHRRQSRIEKTVGNCLFNIRLKCTYILSLVMTICAQLQRLFFIHFCPKLVPKSRRIIAALSSVLSTFARAVVFPVAIRASLTSTRITAGLANAYYTIFTICCFYMHTWTERRVEKGVIYICKRDTTGISSLLLCTPWKAVTREALLGLDDYFKESFIIV